MTRYLFVVHQIFYLALAWALCLSHSVEADERLNVLWIYVDDMSDWVGCYGDDTVPTPHIDGLAAVGVRFENAFVPAPVCSTTRSAIITGAMQTTYGLHRHRTMIKSPLPDGVTTVPQLFREAGYLTFNEAKDDYNFAIDRSEMYSDAFVRPGIKSHLKTLDLSWLEQLQGKAFFGQIQLAGGKTGGETGSKYPAESRISAEEVAVPSFYPNNAVFQNAIARHYEQIAKTDAEVGAILGALEQYGLRKNTVVFFFTDHGCPLPRSKQFLYEGGVKVPLIVAWPEEHSQGGVVREDLVSGIDIAASTLGVAGIEIPEYMEGKDLFAEGFEARKFVISARDRCGIAVDRIRAVRSENFRYIRNFKTDRALYQRQYRENYATFQSLKLMLASGRLSSSISKYFDSKRRTAEELYDLREDPEQMNNLARSSDYQDILAMHRGALDDWIRSTGDQGQNAEDPESLKLVFEGAKGACPAPEFDFLRQP